MSEPLDPEAPETIVLLRSWMEGDERAQRQLFLGLRHFLKTAARNHRSMPILRSLHDEDDVVSEVLARCFEKHAFEEFQTQGRGSLRSFLAVVLDRTMIDLGRRAQASKRGGDVVQRSMASGVAGEPDLLELSSDDTTPTGRARANEFDQICTSVLEGRELEVWTLAQRDGLEPVEIARRLGLTDAAVRGILFRARQKLSDRLEGDAPPP